MSAPKLTAGPTTFQLDTSGAIYLPIEGIAGTNKVAWSDLSPFTQGYIEALFASSQPLNKVGKKLGAFMGAAGFSDLAPETLARIIADCERFLSLPRTDSATVGRDCWNRRHGPFGYAGFPPLTVQLGDDGKVRFAKATGEGAK